jgi:hypothetical protein
VRQLVTKMASETRVEEPEDEIHEPADYSRLHGDWRSICAGAANRGIDGLYRVARLASVACEGGL